MYEFRNNKLVKVKYDSKTLSYLVSNKDYKRVRIPSHDFFGNLRNKKLVYRSEEEEEVIEELMNYFNFELLKDRHVKTSVMRKIKFELPSDFYKKLKKAVEDRLEEFSL